MTREGDTIEAIGSQLAHQVLGSDHAEIVDLRAQRGVGVDALDDLQPFFELKVYGGAEPEAIRLSESEVHRALSADFFIVVASGIAAGTNDQTVTIMTPPHDLIRTGDDNAVYLGVRSVSRRVYRPSADQARPTSSTVDPG